VVFRLNVMQGSEFYQYFEKFPNIKSHFDGIFSIDTLPKTIKYRHFCICNTDLSSGLGEHWFCFVRNSNYEIESFDSLGFSKEKKEKLLSYCSFNYVSEIKVNETQFQSQNSTACGLFTIYFLIERMHNLDLTFSELLEEIFDDDLLKNESIVKQFCDKILKDKL
jgi:hypothetical protein